MSEAPFKFKQFNVKQNRCAMKVGTDAVLLGAWTCISDETESILDIGTGTGIIALQMAQKSDAEIIDALEIEKHAFEQAIENFEDSDWADRLFCYHASLQEFVKEIDDKYDLIVANPPYYTDTFKELGNERAMARHTANLSFGELLDASERLLSSNGSCSFIIPVKEEEKFLQLAKEKNLFPHRITRVKGNSKSPVKRSLLQFGRIEKDVITNELIIEKERHNYTDDYINLVKDYYLKL